MAAKSLRLQLLGWLLVPLAGIVIVNTWVTYRSARTTAGIITDRTLLASARAMAEQIQLADGAMEAIVLPSALEMFASGAADQVYYRIEESDSAAADHLIAGSPDLPRPLHTADPTSDSTPSYFDAQFRGQALRLVAIKQPVAGNPPRAAMIIVGETLGGRARMVADLWVQGFLQQGLLVFIAGIFAWFGLQRGLKPLLRLRDAVIERHPNELEPFPGASLQREVQPLVAALNEHMERVKRWSEVQRRFIANAAHQLRTPVTLLSTQATYALRATSTSEKDEALHAISANLQQMTRLANQLLTLSRVEPGGRPFAVETVDIVATTRQALESLVGIALEREMDLGFDPQVPTATVRGDPTMLQELVVNLVDNALRYTPVRGVVTVGIRRVEGDWQLTVRDNGPGIPAEEREHVFERFYRVLGSGAEGSGLGLAIAKEIVEGSRGSIFLSAAMPDGGGLLVQVNLPAAEGA